MRGGEKAQLEAAALERTLIPAKAVEDDAFAFHRTVRDRLMGIPRRLAANLTAETEQRSAEILSANEISKP